MNESALAAKHSHYSPQPPQNCCVIGRELFPMRRSLLLAPAHRRGHVGVKGSTPAASLLPSLGPGPCLPPLLTKGPGSGNSTGHRGPDRGTVKLQSSFHPLDAEVRKLKPRKTNLTSLGCRAKIKGKARTSTQHPCLPAPKPRVLPPPYVQKLALFQSLFT